MEDKFNEDFLPTQPKGALVEIESARAIQEVQAAMIIAKRFRRNQNESHTKIMKACERYSLADKATYLYPRGDTTVKGPSIRLAEVIAQNWDNLHFGIRELSQSVGRSEAEAFAWDMENNTRQTKIFQVPHVRYSKKKGNVSLSDPRDIYEHVANLGARRMRACILGLIPGDIVEDALAQCEKTLREGNKKKPLQDRIRIMLKSFSDIGVNQDMIENRLDHKVDTIIEDELIELNNIGRSITDNMSSREEWFELPSAAKEKLKGKSEQTGEDIYKTNEATPPEEQTEKEAEEPAKEEVEDPIKKFRGLKTRAFKKVLNDNIEEIPGMPQEHQDAIKALWDGHFSGQPFPIVLASDKPPEDKSKALEIPIMLNCPKTYDEVPAKDDKGRVDSGWCENNCNPEWRESCVAYDKYQKNIGE